MSQLRDNTIGSQKFAHISEGMSVYDVDGDKVGTIKQLYFGASSEKANERGEGAATAPDIDAPEGDTLVGDIARAFGDHDRFPETIRARLLHDGFLRIDSTGIFTSDRYVLPDQISNVSADRVALNVDRDELIKG